MILNKHYKMFSEFEEEFKKLGDFAAYPSSPESSNSDHNGRYGSNWDNSDFLECVKYDEIELEKNPAFFTCVSPVHLEVPSNNPSPPDSPTDNASTHDVSAPIPWELFFPNFLDEFSDDFINDIAKVDINSTLMEAFSTTTSSTKAHNDSGRAQKDVNASVDSLRSVFGKPYHLDFDHCYSAPPKVEEKKENKFNYWDCSPYSPDSSETSSEEVDVVTVPEETPLVPKPEPPHKNTRRRGRKCVKKAQTSLTAKSLKTAIQNSRITTVRRTYNRRKVSNSVETSPSNSVPSSGQSSRCNSDAEDAGKRANHNSSERKRREILRTNLQNLRCCVPATQHNPKAPKVLILNSAADFINDLKHTEQDLIKMKKQEEKRRRQKEAEVKALLAYCKKHC